MDWNKLAAEAHQVAVENGLWDKTVCFDEIAIECHAALARAWEEHKAGRPNLYHLCQPSGEKRLPCALETGEGCGIEGSDIQDNLHCVYKDLKPRGVAAELAGCVLRLLDWLEAQEEKDFVIKDFPWGKDLLEVLNGCHGEISDAAYFSHFHVDMSYNITQKTIAFIERVWSWFKKNRVDMEAVLREVLEYNRRRGKTEGRV